MRSSQHRYRTWLGVSDAGVVVAAVALAHTVRYGSTTSSSLAGSNFIGYAFVSALIAVGWVASLTISRVRKGFQDAIG
jgi:hypothetical protein